MTKAHPLEESPLSSSVAELAHLPRKHLVKLWVKHVGRLPPKAASTSFLLRAAAYRIQEQQYGGLKRQDLRLLHKASDPREVRGNKALMETVGTAIPASEVSRQLPLAFLAPSIVSAILAGKQSPEITAKALLRMQDLPIAWNQQRDVLRFIPNS